MNGIDSIQTNCGDEESFEIKTSKNDKIHFNIKAMNGQIIDSSQMYASKNGAKNGFEPIRKNAPGASTKEM